MLVGLRARGPAFPPGEALRLLDKNPRLWARNGVHKPVRECVKEPLTAQATAALRAAKEVMAANQGVQAPKVTVLDLYALLRRKVSAALTTPPHTRAPGPHCLCQAALCYSVAGSSRHSFWSWFSSKCRGRASFN